MSAGSSPAPTPPRRIRRWHVVIIAIVLVLAAAGLYSSKRSRADVQVVYPTYQDIESSVSTTGTPVPVNDFPARATFTGLVEKIYVHLGQKVRAGQMLIRLRDQYAVPKLDKAKADLDDALLTEQNLLHNGSQEDRIGSQADLVKAQAERDQAAAALQAMKQIQKNGSVSGAEIQAATQRLTTAQANLDALNQKLTNRYSPQDIKSWKDKVAATRAEVQAEKVTWGNANIATPIAGTVYVMPVRLWDFVPAGGDMMHVADVSKLQVRASFEEPDMGKLHVGQPVQVTWDGAPGRVWHGHLESKPLGVRSTAVGSRSVGECIITLEDDHGELPLNTNVAVKVMTEQRRHVLSVPREALHTENGAHVVYRVVNGELKRTPVETGLASAMIIEIKNGLRPEDAVVLHVKDDQALSDGLRVTTVK